MPWLRDPHAGNDNVRAPARVVSHSQFARLSSPSVAWTFCATRPIDNFTPIDRGSTFEAAPSRRTGGRPNTRTFPSLLQPAGQPPLRRAKPSVITPLLSLARAISHRPSQRTVSYHACFYSSHAYVSPVPARWYRIPARRRPPSNPASHVNVPRSFNPAACLLARGPGPVRERKGGGGKLAPLDRGLLFAGRGMPSSPASWHVLVRSATAVCTAGAA